MFWERDFIESAGRYRQSQVEMDAHLPFDCLVCILEYLTPKELVSASIVSKTFFEASAVEHIWRRHSVRRWTFCDASQVAEGPHRWKRYFSGRAGVDAKMDEGRPKFDYRAKTLREPDSNVTQAVFLQGDTPNWEKPLLPLLLTCYENGLVVVWNVNKGETVWKTELEPASCVAVHPCMGEVALGLITGQVVMYSSKDWTVKANIQVTGEDNVAAMKMCYVRVRKEKETGWWLLVGLSSGNIEVLDASEDYRKIGVLVGISSLVSLTALDVSKSGVIAASGTSGDVGVWTIDLLMKNFKKGESPTPHLRLNRRRPMIQDFPIFGYEEHGGGGMRRINLARDYYQFTISGPKHLCWLPQHRDQLAIACGGQIEVWDMAAKLAECSKNYGTWREPDSGYTLSDPSRMFGQHANVRCMVPSGKNLVVGDASGLVHVWSISKGVTLQQFQDHKGAVTSLFGDPFRLVSCSTDYSLRVYRWLDAGGRPVLDSKYTLLGGSVAMKTHDGFNAVLCSLNCCVGVAGKIVKVYIFGD